MPASMEPSCLDAIFFGRTGSEEDLSDARMQKKLYDILATGKGLIVLSNVNLWDCKELRQKAKWQIRYDWIRLTVPKTCFQCLYFSEQAGSMKRWACTFFPRNLMWCKKLHAIRKPAHFSYLSDHCLQQPSILQQNLALGWQLSMQNRVGIRWAWIHSWMKVGIKQKISISVARIWCLTISKAISPERIVAICEPYVAMFISNLITL